MQEFSDLGMRLISRVGNVNNCVNIVQRASSRKVLRSLIAFNPRD